MQSKSHWVIRLSASRVQKGCLKQISPYGLAELRCLCCYDFAFSETSSESLFKFLSASLSIELPHEIKTLCLYLLAVGDVRAYCELSNHCHIQILDVSQDLLNGFVSGLPFSSPPSPLPHLKSPRP